MKNQKKIIFITGAAGFIGFHFCKNLFKNKSQNTIIGFDNLNNYYSKKLKTDRLKELEKLSLKSTNNWKFIKGDLENNNLLIKTFEKYKPEIVVHLAAQAGVRYSLDHPFSYINSNILGFSHILECCRIYNVKNLIYASSSSVYGGNTRTPFKEKDNVDHPVSLYAATKKSNELMAHAYSSLYKIPTTGLRFFTVYGPWGRPDMAPFIFTKSIIMGEPIKVFNNGNSSRDFTYIDDVVEVIKKLLEKPAKGDPKFKLNDPDPSKSWVPYQIFNIGNSNKINLNYFIEVLENEIGSKAKKIYLPMQKGDVVSTHAETKSINEYIKFKPKTNLKDGIRRFVNWYINYYD